MTREAWLYGDSSGHLCLRMLVIPSALHKSQVPYLEVAALVEPRGHWPKRKKAGVVKFLVSFEKHKYCKTVFLS